MTLRDKSRQLREIVEVRVVQRQAAELKVAEANQAIIRLTIREAEQRQALRRDQDQWKAALAAPSLSLPLLGAWSAEILKRQADFAETGRDIGVAQSEKADRSQAWHHASALADAAEQMSDRAETADRRRREETRLNDIADRFAHRVTPW